MVGPLSKMRSSLKELVHYTLDLNDTLVEMNPLIGREISLSYTGRIFCVSCGKQTKKSFGQGFCYPCFMNSPDNAECIVKPELCRAHLGEGRDPEWEEKNHNTPHVVYLALSSGIKVGVTRATQVPTRWIDQGANAAIILANVPYRQLAGAIEVELKNYFPDKTNWQRMLKNEVEKEFTLSDRKKLAIEKLPDELKKYAVHEDLITEINYPVEVYPLKVVSQTLEKVPEITGVLKGIKAQYLIFEGGKVFNVRNNSGYEVQFSAR